MVGIKRKGTRLLLDVHRIPREGKSCGMSMLLDVHLIPREGKACGMSMLLGATGCALICFETRKIGREAADGTCAQQLEQSASIIYSSQALLCGIPLPLYMRPGSWQLAQILHNGFVCMQALTLSLNTP